MNALPLVERELRAAARRRGTYHLRWWAAGLGVALWLWFLWLGTVGFRPRQIGKDMFDVLAWLLLAFCLFEAVRQTADCLSEEKRDGTLGLLFLADLSGSDVVLGKLTGASIRTFCSLLALIPALALSLTLGGVTGGEFWRVALAVAVWQLCALTGGLLVSAFSFDNRRAIAGTLALLLTLHFLPVGVAALLSLAYPNWSHFAWISPFTGFLSAFAGNYQAHGARAYCVPLAAGVLWSAGFLALAAWRIGRDWCDAESTGRHRLVALVSQVAVSRASKTANRAVSRAPPISKSAIQQVWKSAPRHVPSADERPPARGSLDTGTREAWREANPVAWLAARTMEPRPPFWFGLAALCTVWFVAWQMGRTLALGSAWLMWWGLGVHFLIGWVARIAVAIGAAHTFAELRRTGAFELLLCAPLTSQTLVSGHWQAARRTWLWPATAAWLLKLTIAMTVLAETRGSSVSTLFFGTAGVAWTALAFPLDLLAVFWVASWLGLRGGRATAAAINALLVCQVLPFVLACGLTLLTDVIFIIWAHDELRRKFHQTVQAPLGARNATATGR